MSSSASKTLADITDERQLPLGYLTALITLFLIMVGDRVFYSQVRRSEIWVADLVYAFNLGGLKQLSCCGGRWPWRVAGGRSSCG